MRLSAPQIAATAFGVSGIHSLHAPCSPSNIASPVVTVIVDPIKSMSLRRTLTDVSKERLKRGNPFRANPYTSSAVVFKSLVIRISAALLHVLPYRVFRRTPHSACGIASVAMLSNAGSSNLNGEATARLSMPTEKVRLRNYRHRSASTSTLIVAVAARLLIDQLSQYQKSPECLSRQIMNRAHACILAGLFAAGWCNRVSEFIEVGP